MKKRQILLFLAEFAIELEQKKLSKIFANLRDQLKTQGYMNEVFSFIDASHLIAKASLWQERDQAIKKKYDKLNKRLYLK